MCAWTGDGEQQGLKPASIQMHLGCEDQKTFNARLRQRGFLSETGIVAF